MRHTPYGYAFVDGKVVIDEEKAAKLRKICENYLGGMSFVAAAADVGLTMTHCGVKGMILNKRYLGDNFYPAILTQETVRRIEEERLKREEALGRERKSHRKESKAIVHERFSIPRVPKKYKDPISQAEYVYSLIKSEVNVS